MTRYRVSQYGTLTGFIHSKTYRFRWWAKVRSWTLTGTSLSGMQDYFTTITEENR